MNNREKKEKWMLELRSEVDEILSSVDDGGAAKAEMEDIFLWAVDHFDVGRFGDILEVGGQSGFRKVAAIMMTEFIASSFSGLSGDRGRVVVFDSADFSYSECFPGLGQKVFLSYRDPWVFYKKAFVGVKKHSYVPFSWNRKLFGGGRRDALGVLRNNFLERLILSSFGCSVDHPVFLVDSGVLALSPYTSNRWVFKSISEDLSILDEFNIFIFDKSPYSEGAVLVVLSPLGAVNPYGFFDRREVDVSKLMAGMRFVDEGELRIEN